MKTAALETQMTGDTHEAMKVSGMAKASRSTKALREGSFGVRGGEVHGALNENGSGKSALLKILHRVHLCDQQLFREIPRSSLSRNALVTKFSREGNDPIRHAP
jgi:ABC-type phosphonate transport system ATPase subunit